MPPVEPLARRQETRASGAPRRAKEPRVIEGGVFMPYWKFGETGEDLRAPKFRKGGVAVEEAAPDALSSGPGDLYAAKFGRGEAAGGPDADLAQATWDTAAQGVPEILEAPEAEAGPRVIKGEAPPAEGVRSVVFACLIGVLIAALIIAGAFLLRPGSPEPSSEAPPATPQAEGVSG